MNRRKFLQAGVMAGVAASTGVLTPEVSHANTPGSSSKRVLRIAHLTDIHVQPEGDAPIGMERALELVHSMMDTPDMIMNGGDSIMDALGADRDRVVAQWKTWHDILDKNTSIPVVHCIGNHDTWGWSIGKARYRKDEKYGKEWAKDEFQIKERFYSFDKAGWHFIVLDSTHHATGGYIAKLDDLQFEWLQADLAATPKTTPVCVLSHIPILSVTPFFDGDNEKSGKWEIPRGWMHLDARKIKEAFKSHGNVKLCLSGHEHMYDRVEYLGTTYICNGAVSGAWWGGNYQEFPPAYGIVDLYEDGTVLNQFVPYTYK